MGLKASQVGISNPCKNALPTLFILQNIQTPYSQIYLFMNEPIYFLVCNVDKKKFSEKRKIISNESLLMTYKVKDFYPWSDL